MNNLSTLLLFCLLTALFSCRDSPVEQPPRPNVIIILTDDQGWGDLSINGNTNIRTPNIDRLAEGGTRMDRFYVAPVCAPTRAGFLTGRYHFRTGVFGVTQGDEYMNTDEVTLADIFKKGGYATGCFGKWHNGSQYPYHPNGRGFDEFYGFTSGHWANYFNTTLDHNGKDEKTEGYINDVLTDKALEFIDDNKEKPFLCYIPYNTPHSPFQVPDQYYDTLKNRGISLLHRDPEKEHLGTTIAALAMCENIDWNVGRIMQKVEDLGMTDNTIIVYFSDNGPNSWRWNGDMKGRKGSVEEGGVRSPFIMHWPGHVQEGALVDHIAGYTDILPTLAEMAGLSTADCKPLDGTSLKPLLFGEPADWPDRILFSSHGKRKSVRTPRYRAMEDELYDMVNDPGQRNNIAAQFPEIHQSLADTLGKWYAEVTKDIQMQEWYGNRDNRTKTRPFPVGYTEFPTTLLPAQDALLVKNNAEGISFSSPHPNSSWITHWADTAAYPAWDVDIHTSGRYAVSLWYTCSEENAGAAFEVIIKGKTLAGRVENIFDPPLLPSPDRVERSESHEKEFNKMHVGEMTLEKGAGRLVIRGRTITGKQMMDVKGIVLELL